MIFEEGTNSDEDDDDHDDYCFCYFNLLKLHYR